jgi:HK97 family phage major capsid protein
MNGRPILQDALSGIDGAPRKMLLNYPVVTVPEMPLLSSAGITKPIAFGNFRRAYVIRYVGAPSILVNPYSRMQYGEIEYTGEQWADGLVQERAAYVVTRNNT